MGSSDSTVEAVEEFDSGYGQFDQSIWKSARFASNGFFILVASFSDNVSSGTF